MILLAMGIIGHLIKVSSSSNPSVEEAQQLHRTIKKLDLQHDKVHSVVNFDTISQRYQDYKDTQEELKK